MANTINLGTQEGNLVELQDFDHIYKYQRLISPEDKDTEHWVAYVKQEDAEESHIASGVLSKFYTAVATEEVFNTIAKQLGGDVVLEKHHRFGSLSSCNFVMTGYSLDYKDESEANKVIFNLLTGINEDVMDQHNVLSFNILNSLTGSHSLCLNYGYMPNLKSASGQILTVNNLFVLNEFRSRLIHNKKLSLNFSEIQNVKSHLADSIKLYKDTPIDSKLVETLGDKFMKRIIKRVSKIVGKLPDKFMNMYYLTYIISHVSDMEKRLDFDIECRKFITQYVSDYHKKVAKLAQPQQVIMENVDTEAAVAALTNY